MDVRAFLMVYFCFHALSEFSSASLQVALSIFDTRLHVTVVSSLLHHSMLYHLNLRHGMPNMELFFGIPRFVIDA